MVVCTVSIPGNNIAEDSYCHQIRVSIFKAKLPVPFMNNDITGFKGLTASNKRRVHKRPPSSSDKELSFAVLSFKASSLGNLLSGTAAVA
jgi:hypothetical protein